MPYPTPPAPRIAYDKDGSVAFFGPGPKSATPVQLSQPALAAFNSDESDAPLCLNWRTNLGGSGVASISYNTALAGTKFTTVDPLPWVAVLFPRPMQLMAFLGFMLTAGEGQFGIAYSEQGVVQGFTLQSSTDTTNGVDGTWVAIADVTSPMLPGGDRSDYAYTVVGPTTPLVTYSTAPDVNAFFRRSGDSSSDGYGWKTLSTVGLRNVVGVRMLLDRVQADPAMRDSNGLSLVGFAPKLHLYGLPETTYDPHKLQIVPSAAGAVSLDMGNVPQGQSRTLSFTVHNTSASLTARAVSLTVNGPNASPPTGMSSPATVLSADGGTTWASNLTIGDIAPGASSSTIQVRGTAPSSNLIGVWSPRVSADAGSWS